MLFVARGFVYGLEGVESLEPVDCEFELPIPAFIRSRLERPEDTFGLEYVSKGVRGVRSWRG